MTEQPAEKEQLGRVCMKRRSAAPTRFPGSLGIPRISGQLDGGTSRTPDRLTMTILLMIRRRFQAQQKEEAVEIFESEGLPGDLSSRLF